MGTVESITVEVSVHDERLALQREAEREVVEHLKTRIFFSREQGNQRYYYDVETGTSNLTLMYIIQMVIDSMPTGRCGSRSSLTLPGDSASLKGRHYVVFLGGGNETFTDTFFNHWANGLPKAVRLCGRYK